MRRKQYSAQLHEVGTGRRTRKHLYRGMRPRKDNGDGYERGTRTDNQTVFSNVLATRQMRGYASAPNSPSPLVRSDLPYKVSDDDDGKTNFPPGQTLTDGIDEDLKIDAGKSASFVESAVAVVLAPQNRRAASVDIVSYNHSGTMQSTHQSASPSDDERSLSQSVRDDGDIQPHNVTQDDLCNADQGGDTSVDMAAAQTNSETTGQSDDDVEAALEYYSVVRNGLKNHYIKRHDKSVPQWNSLTSLPYLDYHGVRYKVGDVVYILLQDNDEDSFGKIREIRDLADGRKVISVLWYFTAKDARSYGCTTLKRWPKGKSHMLTSMLQVLMWDTINGMVDENVLKQVASGKILDIYAKTCKILESDAKAVTWINEPALVCESCE